LQDQNICRRKEMKWDIRIIQKVTLSSPSLWGLEWTSSHQCTSSGWGCSSRFGDEPKHILFHCPGIFQPPSLPQNFPSYLLHLISRSLHHQSLGGLSSLSSTDFWENARHKVWGRWRAQCWRNMERRQEEHFIPNVEAREKR
jgi:hypothetical protein